MRITTASPWTLGSVTTRRSTWWPSIVRPTRPSCGRRRSAMSRSAMILMRDTTPATMRRGTVVDVAEHAVDAEAHAHLACRPARSGCRSAVLDRLGDDLVDELDDRRVVGGLAQVDDLGGPPSSSSSVDVVATASSRRSSAADRARAMSSRRGDRGPDLVAGHDRDVVDREHVGRVGHRDEQRALVGERDGHAPRSAWRRVVDQVRGGHVDLEDAQVEVVEAVALGDRARELVVR